MDDIYVVSAPLISRKKLTVVVVDTDGDTIDLTAAQVRVQGRSNHLPNKSINHPGTVLDGPAGLCEFTGLGNLVTQEELDAAGIPEAIFRMQLEYEVPGNLADLGPPFEWRFIKGPLVP